MDFKELRRLHEQQLAQLQAEGEAHLAEQEARLDQQYLKLHGKLLAGIKKDAGEYRREAIERYRKNLERAKNLPERLVRGQEERAWTILKMDLEFAKNIVDQFIKQHKS